MSDYRGHVAAGAASYAVLAFACAVVAPAATGLPKGLFVETWREVPPQLLVAVLAALWPDVDTPSTGRKLFYRLFLALDIYLVAAGKWQGAALLGLFAILPGIGKHRGWTHRLWAAFVVPLPIVAAPLFLQAGGTFAARPDYTNLGQGAPYYFAAVAGYTSHLAADGTLGRGAGAVLSAALWPVRAISKATAKDRRNLGGT